ncbi:MAG: glutamate 5-kinase [Firmicutes bacterium]|nr:glutamate 5-kinase [Bacillota bacterium]
MFHKANRIVVKVGTSSLTYPTGKLNLHRLDKLAAQIADLWNEGRQVILVSSGAIGAGMSRLGLTRRPVTVPEKQAVAAVGQGQLMHIYEKIFSEYGWVVAQVLLTRSDLAERQRHLNARHALQTLLSLNVIPIINENDTVAVDEIKFGDNDTLAALVAGLVDADLLVLLSDVDGLYDRNPQEDNSAQLIPLVTDVSPELMQAAAGAGTALGTGGMVTKLRAARIAVKSGIPMCIANAATEGVLRALLAGEDIGTLFVPQSRALGQRKQWIAFSKSPAGAVLIDAGACQAVVEQGKSLLPVGVLQVQGQFRSGDLIQLLNEEGVEVARGLSNYSSTEVSLIAGKHSSQLSAILKGAIYEEVVHRDNLIVSQAPSENTSLPTGS